MYADSVKTVLRLYNWLPPEGEVSISVRSTGADVYVDVLYERESDRVQQLKTIIFDGVCDFDMAAFPGLNLLAVDYEKHAPSGDLVEYEESEAAKAWTEHFRFRTVRHFQVYFLSANRRLDIFAQGWRLEPLN